MNNRICRKNVRTVLSLTALAIAAGLLGANANAAKVGGGGTAKPPVKGVVAPFVTPTLPDPIFSVVPTLIHGFDVTGFIQDATLDASNANCPAVASSAFYGGTVTVNGSKIIVPCNTVIQMPANTITWAQFINGGSLSLDGAPTPYPSNEVHVIGNNVNAKLIAGLIFVSQQAGNVGNGYISAIDYTTGNLLVANGTATPTVVQINDPNGRFGRAQSPDPRFSVDDQNPTIHAGTGYPMCVPRVTADPNAKVKGVANPDDPLCPAKNRPAPPCRNFSQAGVAPPVAGELTAPAIGQTICSQFVMKAPPGTPGLLASQIATAADPDVRQQAPFRVGDFIHWQGTLHKSAAGGPDFVSAHTIEASVGIYTQPGTKPSYVAIGDFGLGTADPALVAVNGAPQETQNRIFIEVLTTDFQTPVDIYLVDTDAAGVEHNRWVTPWEMTGECNPALALAANCKGFSGGITTQATGANPTRARLRATKAPVGLLSAPPRTVRAMARTECVPDAAYTSGVTTATDTCIATAAAPASLVANGLKAGMFQAPVFDFIFPENLKPGDAIVPNDFWHLPFLVFGEGANGPLLPPPW